jgi:hypothetical protein
LYMLLHICIYTCTYIYIQTHTHKIKRETRQCQNDGGISTKYIAVYQISRP